MIGIIFIFILGLFFGSFLNVVVDRQFRGESFLFGRSHCDFCKHILKWYDLLPVISFLLLKGRCRYCKKKFGIKYPFIEVTTGILFGITFFFFMMSEQSLLLFLLFLPILCGLIVIFFEDLLYGFIPDWVLFFITLFTIPYLLVSHISFLGHITTGIITGALFLLLYLVTGGKGMGFGDVKYAFFMGFLIGFPNIIPGLYGAFLTGAICSLILIVWCKKPFFGTSIPFGPFLVGATCLALFFGNQLWSFLLQIMHL